MARMGPLSGGGSIVDTIPTLGGNTTPSTSSGTNTSFGLNINPFSGLESWIKKHIEEPITGYIGTEIAPISSKLVGLESDVGDITDALPGLARGLSGVGEGIAGVALAIATQIPQVKTAIHDVVNAENALAGKFETALSSGLGTIEGGLSTLSSDVQSSMNTIDTTLSSELGKVEGGLSTLSSDVQSSMNTIDTTAAKIEKYAGDIEKMAPTVQLIETQVEQFPTELTHDINKWWDDTAFPDITNWWNNTALPDIEDFFNGTDIKNALDTISSKLTTLATDLENLPADVESYVEAGVRIELRRLWKKIELPTLVFGGIVLWKLFDPSCCKTKQVSKRQVKRYNKGVTA